MSSTTHNEPNSSAAAAGSQGANAPTGEFHSSVERSEPLSTHGHKPGVMTGNDAVPEFSAKTLPAGTAPIDRTFKPNNASEIPPMQDDSSADPDAPTQTSASDTLGGATSGDVHTGLGHPGQGQTSSELRHEHQGPASLEGRGASGAPSANLVDAHDPAFQNQRALDKDEAEVGRGNIGGPSAEERIPESADSVASGRS